MKKFITVYGMTCERCRKLITHELQKVKGVNKVTVTLPNSLVDVDFDEKTITLEEIKNFIQKLGYDPL